jgi:hypothetical protein
MKDIEHQEEDDSEEEEESKLEDVRMSNFAYSQTKISEYISFYFASLGVGSSIVAAEMSSNYNINGQLDGWIFVMILICNASTGLLRKSICISTYSD